MLEKMLSEIGNPDICPSAVFLREGKILMGLRHYTLDKWKKITVWTIPGGRCDECEIVEVTLLREIQEETGITDLEILDYIGEVPGAKEGDIVLLFFCKTFQDPKLMEPHKFSKWQWFDLFDFPKNFINDAARQLIVNFFDKNK